ncbi:DUF5107 domain-containing protein [Paenibacillus sp. PAMC21692]|uniref:DUF5107 domain-containing protein n=1 Tax=Paenibacillus sp. PAMC21692 TaxID=2762320 RepID=UPI00164E2C41|nr:DUF5107 domain-containing protein [Paenibacillus sp. PAMC21692]QNK55022.1 DUF5107 domain-containing protein [Paenibacillus sp. PAMC21692]
MSIKLSTLQLPGAPLESQNPLPMFRSRKRDREVPVNSSYPDRLRPMLGYETGERFLPYRMQDRYSRKRMEMSLDTIILENELLEAVFMPQYGGRLYSLIDKRTNRNLLYTNPVFQPGNLAILNAWFSGGIEWNIGQVGHAFTTTAPLHAAMLKDNDGNEFLRFYEYERCKNVFWHIDFHLPAGSDKLIAYVRIINDNDHSVPMYWWTNTAVEETEKARVFSTTDEVIFFDQRIKGFGHGVLPELATVPGEDVSYPINFPFSNEFFFQTVAENKAPWEAVAYEDGKLFYERSTSLLRYRKMFCWGHHPGGRRWCDFLSDPGKGNYIEIQAGLAPTQLHGLDMPAHSEWDFTQIFGLSDVNTMQSHQKDWRKANEYIMDCVDKLITEADVYNLHETARSEATKAPIEKLYDGSEWGGLEEARRSKHEQQRNIPAGFNFSLLSADAASKSVEWIQLLENGTFPVGDVNAVPPAWMVQREWLELLETSLRSSESNKNWNAYMHLGVMLYELGKEDEAMEAWKTSIQLQPSAWVYRNLAVAMTLKEDNTAALGYMDQAFQLSQSFPDRALAEEYLKMLIDSERYKEAWSFFHTLPEEYATNDRILIIVGAAALELDKEEFLSELFQKEFAVVREGEMLIINLWYKYNAKKLAAQRDEALDDSHIVQARKNFPPPNHIDFRIVGDE